MTPMKSPRLLLVFIFFITVLLSLWSQPCTVLSSKSEITFPPPAIDLEFKPEIGIYYYSAEWNSVNVGKASIELLKEDSQYKMIVHARTNKQIDIIYKLRYRGESVMDGQTLAPIEVRMQEDAKSRKKNTIMKFNSDGTIETTESKKKKRKPEEKKVTEIKPVGFHLDPFSATCLVRRLDWEVGVADVFDIVLGTDTYELKLLCIGKESIEFSGKDRMVYIIVPEVSKKGRKKKKKAESDLKIFLSADKLKEVLKIDASHKLGTFRVILDKFVPKESPKDLLSEFVRQNASFQ